MGSVLFCVAYVQTNTVDYSFSLAQSIPAEEDEQKKY
jgi:hypothetical protein